MKKITTFLMIFAMSVAGFAQVELVTNGDFESAPDGSWFGNAFNIVTQGTNKLNEADVQAAGNPFDVNLSQVITLQDGMAYELSFDAFTDATTGSRDIVVGLGKNGGDFAALTETATLTSTSQTFTYQFTIGYGDSVDDRVLFDMGAEVGFVFLDNVSVTEVQTTCNNGVQDGDETGIDCGGSCPPCEVVPTVAAPTPPNRPAGDVISIYGDAYGADTGLTNVPWDDPTVFTEVTEAGDDMLRMDFGTFLGSNLDQVVDATGMTHFHMDFWVSDNFQAGQVFNTKWSNHANGTSETDAGELTIALGPNDVQTWVSIDVPLSDFNNVNGNGIDARAALTQFLITPSGTIQLAFVDNIYFHKNTTLSNNEFKTAKFSVYPNPSSSNWTISASVEMTSVKVYNTLGKLVLEQEINADHATISSEALPTGVYFAQLENDAKSTKTIRLIKN